MDPECLRRTRNPGRRLFSEAFQRSLLRAFSWNHHHCRRINGVARSDAANVSRGAWLRVQMEHGMDARFPALHEHRSDLPAVFPPTISLFLCSPVSTKITIFPLP